MKNRSMIISLAIAAFFGFACSFVLAQQNQEPPAQNEKAGVSVAQNAAQSAPSKDKAKEDEESDKVDTQEVSGEVSAISPNGIAVVYDHNYDTGAESEAYIPFDKNTVIKHKGSIKEIKVGDFISVEVERHTKKIARAKVINFIQPGMGDLVSKPGPAVASVPAATNPDESAQ